MKWRTGEELIVACHVHDVVMSTCAQPCEESTKYNSLGDKKETDSVVVTSTVFSGSSHRRSDSGHSNCSSNQSQASASRRYS